MQLKQNCLNFHLSHACAALKTSLTVIVIGLPLVIVFELNVFEHVP